MTAEHALDLQKKFQETWNKVPFEDRQKLFPHFVAMTEYFEELFLRSPSEKTLPKLDDRS